MKWKVLLRIDNHQRSFTLHMSSVKKRPSIDLLLEFLNSLLLRKKNVQVCGGKESFNRFSTRKPLSRSYRQRRPSASFLWGVSLSRSSPGVLWLGNLLNVFYGMEDPTMDRKPIGTSYFPHVSCEDKAQYRSSTWILYQTFSERKELPSVFGVTETLYISLFDRFSRMVCYSCKGIFE